MDGTSGQGGGMEDRELEELMVKSFIQIMMETEKTAEGKAELAQAQENDRRRRETQQQLQLQVAGDAIHINGTNESSLQPPPPQYLSSQQQQQQQPQAKHSGIVAFQPQDYNHQQRQQQQNPNNTAHANQHEKILQQQYQHITQSQLNTNQHLSQTQEPLQLQHPQSQQLPQHQHPSQPLYQRHNEPNNQRPQTYDPYYHFQLQQQQQQQLQQQYQQQLIQLQQQQQQHLQQQQHQLQQQQQFQNLNDPTQLQGYSAVGNVPLQHPQTAIPVNPVIQGNSNNSSNNIHPQSIPSTLQNVSGYTNNDNTNYQQPPTSTINHGNKTGFSSSSQHLSTLPSTMTNTVSKISNNTDATSIDVYAHSGDVYANPDYVSSKAGPLGMSMLDGNGQNGPKIIVLDESDNDVEEVKDNMKDRSKLQNSNHIGSLSNFKSDVYPISPKAVERDMFKQEYRPQSKKSQNDNSNMDIHQGDISNNVDTDRYQNDPRERDNNTFDVNNIDPTAFGYPDITKNPDLLLSQPSENEEEDNRNQASITPLELPVSPRRLRQQNPLSYQELLQQKLHLQNELYMRQQKENQHMLNEPYSRAGQNGDGVSDHNQKHGIDFDRYTHIPSQLTSIMEDTTIPLDSYRENLGSSMDTYRTVDPDPFGNDQEISIDIEREISKDKIDKTKLGNYNRNLLGSKSPSKNNQRFAGQRYLNPSPTIKIHNAIGTPSPSPAFKVLGPGYKVDVSVENVVEKRATRANILNRAERLLDARRVQHLTDKSDSSGDDLNKDDDGYDEEDDDDVQELRGPRHRALRHIKPQYYDDTTSYNSSDDILNTLRYSRQGPLTKAARRARLTSFNARLHKQRRVKAALRLSSRDDTDLNNYLEKGLVEEETEKEKFDSEISELNTNSIVSDLPQNASVPPQEPPATNKKQSSPRKTNNFSRKPKLNGIPKKPKKAAAWQPKPTLNQTPKLDPISANNNDNAEDMDEAERYGATRPRNVTSNKPFKGKAVVSKLPDHEMNNLLRTMSDDEFDSSENDNPGRYEDRYEESKLRDVSNDQRYQETVEEPPKKGRRVYFFRNGDCHYKPKQVLISSRTYQNFEKLLVDLSSIVETSTGVKYIFSWPDGKEMNSLTQFENGKYYICSSTKKLQIVDYGNSREGPWKAGKIERQEHFLFQKVASIANDLVIVDRKNGKVQSPLRKPRILTIISNLYRDSREKLILNTSSAMNFEDILNDIANMVNIPNPPVKALYTERKPHQQVLSYSQLIRDFADHDNFIACGEEMVPLEMANKRPRHATAGSSDGSKKGQKKTPRYVSQDEGGGGGSPTRSSAMTGYTDFQRQARPDPRRRKLDSIRVDINGKTREFFPPTVFDEEDDGMKPGKKLKLEWVYGFRGRDVKQNLVVLPSSGELVYFVAAVVVLYDKKFATQKHYLGHNEEVTCLTIHPNGRFLASGQLSGKSPESGAHIRIWDGMSLSTYAVIGLGVFSQGIACINFSERESSGNLEDRMITGDLLMAIDDSDRHVLSVWEWQTEKLVSKTTTTSDPVVSGCFYPFDDTIIITYGKEHIHFWRMFWEKDRKVMRDKLSGHFEEDVPKFVTSICFSPSGDVITGDSHGAILIWTRDNNSVFAVNDNLSIQTKRAHKKSVASLCMLGDGTLLSGGGNEVKAWDSINDYSLVKERVLPDNAGHVRSIVPITTGGLDGSIYVSTTKNKVLEGSLQLKFKSVIQGHVEELWAVESHPLEQTFVTAGHDQAVVKWSAVSHAAVWRVDIEKPCVSISIDPKGRLIALGTTGGKVIILNSYNGIQLTTLLAGPNQVNALSFSPDGKQLAVGTYDGSIIIFYTQSEGYKFFSSQSATLKHNNVFIMHMDWSADCKFLQVVLGDYDVIYWDLSMMKRTKSPRALRDVTWATHNCPIGYPVIGPWQNLDRGDVLNVVCRSQYRDMMVAGDNKGRLRLYKWPCSVPKAGYRSVKVYSSNVTTAAFTSDDGYLITSGGNDAALMQFSVLDPINTR